MSWSTTTKTSVISVESIAFRFAELEIEKNGLPPTKSDCEHLAEKALAVAETIMGDDEE